jgi:hypothetical protein
VVAEDFGKEIVNPFAPRVELDKKLGLYRDKILGLMADIARDNMDFEVGTNANQGYEVVAQRIVADVNNFFHNYYSLAASFAPSFHN